MEWAVRSDASDLYRQELFGPRLATWLAAIEALGVFGMRCGETKSIGVTVGAEIECIHAADKGHEREFLERSLILRFKASGLERFEMAYRILIRNDAGDIAEKVAHYTDSGDNDFPIHNTHYIEWCRVLGLRYD